MISVPRRPTDAATNGSNNNETAATNNNTAASEMADGRAPASAGGNNGTRPEATTPDGARPSGLCLFCSLYNFIKKKIKYS